MGRIFDEEKSYLQNFIKWDVTHIGRKGNRVAHCSARYVKTKKKKKKRERERMCTLGWRIL